MSMHIKYILSQIVFIDLCVCSVIKKPRENQKWLSVSAKQQMVAGK